MESMEEALPGTNEQALHYLINDADWDYQDVLSDVAKHANSTLGGSSRSCLLIDETYFAKKGTHSAGVARQWNGRLGKTDNCQVGVFSALCRDNYSVPIDTRLYLPQSWIDSPARLKKAKVPEQYWTFKTKTELAIEQVERALENGIQFAWVGVDGGYGKCPIFHDKMEEFGVCYSADVHKSQKIYLEDPHPQPMGKKKRLKATTKDTRLDKWLEKDNQLSWEHVNVRVGTKGLIALRCKRFSAWMWNEKDQHPKARRITVLISQMPDGSDTKYTITNADSDAPTEQLLYQQRQRFWVEQAFKDGKSEVGMHQYQVRSWHGWHRHMALCSMALLFMAELKCTSQETLPLLSAHDARDILATEFLGICIGAKPPDQLERIIVNRHVRRFADISRSYQKHDLDVPERYIGK